ncbi:protein-export chaperone SecB [Pseudoroseomonas ludipueritiae]|uniref:Protein-export protein SecB n=1 Tax=Pseudoroseomonas ludipueritiae TaxID=198093 RepID=A0ABR7RC36_9PROT|nr:protein-export chaperone SecB [Pseudoroseomonas ludipueritiae]MBC9179196.1 protein-export chaperone SecB [Pseudoroseomonas ludipueritiae]MCG7362789.1 protein-export chaperone SecB [Roseomonas sp. ACRSG]
MSETQNPIPNGAAQPGQPTGPLVMNLQYTKDLSFEVPGAPEIFTQLREQPRIDLSLDVQARALQEGGNVYEVALQIRADAQAQINGASQPAFIAELVYCGIFTLNVEPQMVEPLLLVECPRLLFPFARNILADVTRDGGFPPVLLSPIDFVALWQSRRGAQTAAAAPVANA